MRALFGILGLLLCLTGNTGGRVTGDERLGSRSIAGGNVEVRGLVVSVTTSSLGTAFINFGLEYPDQAFAGFISAGSKVATDHRITTLPGKTIGITGKIELYQGKPEIQITSADQIKDLDS